jgi:hypothetical protein
MAPLWDCASSASRFDDEKQWQFFRIPALGNPARNGGLITVLIIYKGGIVQQDPASHL